jgi:hypothetical protein
MRRTVFALTVIFLGPTAAMALSAGGELALGAAGAAVQNRQISPGGVAGSDQGGSSGGNVILAKGDKTGTGGGHGGHKGQKKGEKKGGQHGKQK